MSDASTHPGTELPDHIHDEPVGHPAIDEALERLDRLGELEITSHPAEFDAIHRVLRESLANAGRDGVLPESA